ncbi:MAG: hypothetical protein GY727_04280 [Gammaproteobacteria bacterium]|nr:hypothetical protein [Gammaproteobacteria bacterium]MCP4090057.1 hypothetical protein [Gammaproteobacteria bacterium]MCP4277053.1 hypothetical protein [Gammaproteobacteria bacterium]MCP4832724.1 hypothetical protein [Gammaproteobacteria bacterium]MCP4929917.1 hypothetical protein [Gammaproteobacteria bacterium]
MQGLKLMLVISLGLGSTWAAWQIAPAASSGMLAGVAYAQEAQLPAEQDEPTEPTVAEIEAQLARIEEAMETQGEVKEFKSSEPLPADMAIPMFSEL